MSKKTKISRNNNILKCDLNLVINYIFVLFYSAVLYYGESMALATYAIILTALLRKLQDTNTKMPNWISSTTSFVLSNKAGRFLISNDKDFEMTDEDATNEGISELPKSKEMKIKELSWRHFASIVSWLSLFCVVFVYIIIFIIFTPVRFNL